MVRASRAPARRGEMDQRKAFEKHHRELGVLVTHEGSAWPEDGVPFLELTSAGGEDDYVGSTSFVVIGQDSERWFGRVDPPGEFTTRLDVDAQLGPFSSREEALYAIARRALVCLELLARQSVAGGAPEAQLGSTEMTKTGGHRLHGPAPAPGGES
jgi:hypothetical protein